MVSLGGIARKIFGSSNDRRVKSMRPRVEAINAMENEVAALSDAELRARTDQFRQDLTNGASLDDLLVPAFATVREAAKRVLGMRPFDVQLIGGMVLHGGDIAEMRTGEGKTLVATLPVYLNALAGKGVHVVTVNDYLATRDAEWMGRVYKFLGLTVGIIVHGLSDEERRAAYACDVTYATNNELGFDYLRDNMKYERGQMVQREHNYAIVDEVDSILVDEARTPLIISGPLEDRSEMYNTIDAFILQLEPADYEVDEKQKTSIFTEEGTEKLENMLRAAGHLKGESLYDVENVAIVHHVNNALKAHRLFQRDKDYIVRNGEIVIIDEFTGRMMPGRRYSEGLHQALEAKEHVAIQPENQTLASITFQNYFRMYAKLSGMTGTAQTEAEEFGNIYNLNVLEIPTNLPVRRLDEDDEVYRTVEEKYKAIVREIRDANSKGQPILVGTTSIEKSEFLAERLRKEGMKGFQVLNARHHEQEASIVAQAGVPGAVTIATNMAGRGTDIQLGGNAEMRIVQELGDMPEGEERAAREKAIRDDIQALKEKALAAGGLYVLATERHESRRIDNQLRGRSGRQGDPGRSKFFLSLQDDLMRIFGSERMDGMLQKLGLKEDEAIIHPWINKALEKAQKKVEARNFDIRKNLLKYDDVSNDQRKVVFARRIELMDGEGLGETIAEMREERHRRSRQHQHPRERLCRAMECRRAEGRRAPVSQPRPADRGLGQGRRHRGRGDPQPPDRTRRQGSRRPRRTFRPRHHGLCRTLGGAADARPSVARTHRQSRPSALGGRLPRLCAARPAAGIQAGSVRTVPGHARQPQPGGDRAADARRAGAGSRRSAAAAGARNPRSPYRRHHRRGRFRRNGSSGPPGSGARRRARRPRPQRPVDLGQGWPQRGLPLRFGQEIQALSRRIRLMRRACRAPI